MGPKPLALPLSEVSGRTLRCSQCCMAALGAAQAWDEFDSSSGCLVGLYRVGRLYPDFTVAPRISVNSALPRALRGWRHPAAMGKHLYILNRVGRLAALTALALAVTGCVVLPFGRGSGGHHRGYYQDTSPAGHAARPGGR